MADKPDIRVTYRSIDKCYKYGRFRTLAGAQKFAQRYVGKTPEISLTFGYAVSDDGIGKITCRGCNIRDLFLPIQTDKTGPFVSCCTNPRVRGGQCTNCGTWIEDPV